MGCPSRCWYPVLGGFVGLEISAQAFSARTDSRAHGGDRDRLHSRIAELVLDQLEWLCSVRCNSPPTRLPLPQQNSYHALLMLANGFIVRRDASGSTLVVDLIDRPARRPRPWPLCVLAAAFDAVAGVIHLAVRRRGACFRCPDPVGSVFDLGSGGGVTCCWAPWTWAIDRFDPPSRFSLRRGKPFPTAAPITITLKVPSIACRRAAF